jgi:hypothetical protein
LIDASSRHSTKLARTFTATLKPSSLLARKLRFQNSLLLSAMAPKWSRHASAAAQAASAHDEHSGETRSKFDYPDILIAHSLAKAEKDKWDEYFGFAFTSALRVAEKSDQLPDQRGLSIDKIDQLKPTHIVAAMKALGSNCPVSSTPLE